MTIPVRSMTGFARIQKPAAVGELSVTLKSVNHRGLDLHFHISSDLDPFEPSIRSAVKRAVSRGHVDIRVSVARATEAGSVGLNEPLLNAYVAAFRKAAELHKVSGAEPDLNAALRLPGMLNVAAGPEIGPEDGPAILAALDEALAELNEFRSREGGDLAKIIRRHNDSIGAACAEFEQIRSRAMPLFQQRLTDRLKELLGNANLEPQRLAQEAALLADRGDIGEEIARLRIHSEQLDEIVKQGGEVGKKLDFLLQEMNREANTILSKTSGIGELGLKITELALGAKGDIEKIREQALNLE